MVEPLSSIRGQEPAMSLLRRYLDAGTVPAGLLFHGEEGTGKEKAALAFSSALLCRSRGEDGACGRCADCLLLSSGAHPNLLRISPENHYIQIDAVRQLKEELSLKAFSDRPRAVIVCPADRMTLSAANALLKTLEEPPASTHLLLVAHRLSQLPLTVVSRCQKVPFRALPSEVVAGILAALPGIGKRSPREALLAAAGCSGGSPGRALLLLADMDEDRKAWTALFSRTDPAAIFAASEEWKKSGEREGLAAVPLSVVRDLALLSSGGKADIINEDFRDVLSGIAERKSGEAWTRAFRALLSMSRLPPQAQKRLAMEAFLFGLHGKG